MTLSPLRRFLLAALLWLPFAFFVWFWFAAPFVWPVIYLTKRVLLDFWPQLFTSVSQGADLLDAQGHVREHAGYLMQLSTSVFVNAAPAGEAARFGFIEPTVNPMVYGYGLPLLAGLCLAVPGSRRRRLWQLALGFAVILPAQTFGVVAECLKVVVIDTGASGIEAAQRADLSPNLIALCYQFGYLILPPLVPAVLWIACNRPFIQELVRHDRKEPAPAGGVEALATGIGSGRER